MFASSKLCHIFSNIRPNDKLGRAHVLLVPYTQLAVIVQTPGEQLAFLVSIEGGMTSAKDIGSLFGANLLYLHMIDDSRTARNRHSADFATLWVAPGPHFPVCGQGHVVI